MPNHITNIIRGPKALIDYILNEAGNVDFDTVIPMPGCIHQGDVSARVETMADLMMHGITENPSGDLLEDLKRSNKIRTLTNPEHLVGKFSDQDFEELIAYMRAYREVGYATSLTWSIANWGTKWNAYETDRIDLTEVQFQTAWRAPHPVIERLASLCLGEFVHLWADEDFGYNCGIREYSSTGEKSDREIPKGGTTAAYEIAFQVLPERRKYYKLIDGKYEYCEESEEVGEA